MMNTVLKKTGNVLTTLVVIFAVVMAVLLAGMRLLGFQVFTVLSGSMEPAYPTGALLYVKDADPYTLRPGDPITFLASESTVVTHRITRIVTEPSDPDTLWFYTQGDANKQEDAAPVHYKNVLGKPMFYIPCLGYVASFVQTPPGTYIAGGVCAVMLIFAFLPIKKRKQEVP